MKTIGLFLLGATLLLPASGVAQDRERHEEEHRRYEDRKHRDQHEWNDNEDRAYRRYLETRRQEYRGFDSIKAAQQQAYWNWRHSHPDDRR